jgi:hypothetical protein
VGGEVDRRSVPDRLGEMDDTGVVDGHRRSGAETGLHCESGHLDGMVGMDRVRDGIEVKIVIEAHRCAAEDAGVQKVLRDRAAVSGGKHLSRREQKLPYSLGSCCRPRR